MKAIGYEVADFAENGMDAEAKATVEFPYVAEAEYIVVDMDDTTVVFYVTFAEGSIELDDGNEAILLEEYVPVVPEVSEEDSSEDEESSEEEPEESSEEESVETPATSTAESSADTSAAPAEDGDSTLLIVIIAVVAVVIIGAVAFIVIKRKK